jgi:hypothetical protein
MSVGDLTDIRTRVEVVRVALAVDPLAADIRVRPCICFIDAEWGLFSKPFIIDGVVVAWPQQLVKRIVASGVLTATAVARIANRIAVALPSATSRKRATRQSRSVRGALGREHS